MNFIPLQVTEKQWVELFGARLMSDGTKTALLIVNPNWKRGPAEPCGYYLDNGQWIELPRNPDGTCPIP